MRGPRAGATAVALTVAALLVSAPAGPARADGPGLVFAEPDPYPLTWSAVEQGATVALCNTTGRPLAPGVVVTGTDVRVGSSRRNVRDLVTAQLPSGPIGPGACTDVRVTLADAAATDLPGGESATAQLTAVAPGAGSATLALSIVADAAPQLLGSFGDVTLRATRSSPWFGAASLVEPTLWLRYAGTPTPLDPRSVVLVDGAGSATLQLGTDQRAVDGGLSIPLTLVGATRPGTYRGTLELGGPHGSIPVTVVVADRAQVLLGLVLLGVLLALLLRVMSGKWRYRIRLQQARRRAARRYAAAASAMGPDLARRFPPPDPEAVHAWRTGAKAAGRAYFRTVLTVDLTDPAYVSVRTDVTDVLADADCLSRRLPAAVEGLQAALDRLVGFLDLRLPRLTEPDVVAVARALLRDGTPCPGLRVKEATQVTAAADDLARTLDAWQAEAVGVLLHVRWSQRLALGAEFPEQLQLAAVDDALGRAVRELFDATTSAAVAAVGRSEDLREAHRLLATVGARRGVWIDDTLDEAVGGRSGRHGGAFAGLIPERVVPEGDRALTRSERWARSELAPTTFELAHAYVPVLAGVLASVVVTFAGAVVAFGAAAFVAYQTLYVGKPFGSGPDLLAALFAGVAAGAVVDSLVNGLNWARGGVRSLGA